MLLGLIDQDATTLPGGLPFDANLINVRSYGAVGNGVTDDTAAILAAIAALPDWLLATPYLTRIIYFPAGTYLISSTIKRTSKGTLSPDWWPCLVLMGEDQATTSIVMKDGSFAAGVAGILTASPYSATDGGGAFGFNNSIVNLTINAGNNPGAFAIDHAPSNMSVIRNCTVQTSNPAGTAISLARIAPGPTLITDTTITGPFGIGIDVDWSGLSVTLNNITINGTTQFGLRNTMNMVAFYNLSITMAGAGGYAFGNNNPPPGILEPWMFANEGLIVGVNGTVSGTGAGNVSSLASYNFKNVTSTLNSVSISLDGVFHGSAAVSRTGNWALTIESTPASVATPKTQWTKVPATEGADITAILQAACSNPLASVVYIPTGTYQISGQITVADNIDRIDAMYSIVESMTAGPYYLFATTGTRIKPLEIRQWIHSFGVGNTNGINGLINWLSPAPATLTLRDTSGFASAVDANGSGKVYGENVVWTHMNLTNSSPVWMRAFDAETASTKITNVGTNLWILGYKTEINTTAVDSSGGANTEIVGGLFYLNEAQVPPLFLTVDSRVATSHVQDTGNTIGAFAATQFDTTLSAVQTLVPSTSFPTRNPEGSPLAAWYSTDCLPVTTVFLNSSLPVITGIHVGTGNVLTARTGAWYIANSPEGSPNPASFTYQWLRGGTPIAGETNSTYTSAVADLGTNLTVEVVAHNAIGASATATSPPFNITATYVGPGDVTAGWLAWYGLRGFNAAYATAHGAAVNIRRSSDNATMDVLILSTGDLDQATAITWAAGSDCFITTIYDQSGGGFHLTQGTAANQPKILFNELNYNTLPSIRFSFLLHGLTGAFTTASTAPTSTSFVAKSVQAPDASDSFFMGTFDNVYNGVGPNSGGTTWFFDNGSPQLNFAISNSVLHAVNFTDAADWSYSLNIDGTRTTGGAGSVGSRLIASVTGLAIGAYGPYGRTSTGWLTEVGLFNGSINQSAMYTNQSLYWGIFTPISFDYYEPLATPPVRKTYPTCEQPDFFYGSYNPIVP